jgi:ketosteroid isomerase-like protein
MADSQNSDDDLSADNNFVTIKLPPVIQKYVGASNRHDVKSILSCFSNDAVVHDEQETFRGKRAIERWIVKTIARYKFQFKPLSVENERPVVIVAIEVSGTFPGSPVTLDYRFKVEKNNVSSLTID